MTPRTAAILRLLKISAASLAGGVVGAMSGLGGGIGIVPVLTLFLGIPIQDEIAASIVSVIAVSSGAGSVYLKDRITNIRIAMFLELSAGVKNDRLAAYLQPNGSYFDRRLGREIAYNVTGIPAAISLMGLAGIVSGLLGIGAGVVKVLAHEIAMRVPSKVSTATRLHDRGTIQNASALIQRVGVITSMLVMLVGLSISFVHRSLSIESSSPLPCRSSIT